MANVPCVFVLQAVRSSGGLSAWWAAAGTKASAAAGAALGAAAGAARPLLSPTAAKLAPLRPVATAIAAKLGVAGARVSH